ncbi:CD2 antigen cytoplasmic tail-binding protein 2 [Modicella reniformis]|uniref:CD2 antigen cytoplasmic tail-binding protein 2 n=1 Tax=Modicella reniformis TaxID=1440133 RepID=A0A9P6M990_9FUNG|nr:CD2 antigen cytoplasmic tail-binding protein 2 [Modicella reniformis]
MTETDIYVEFLNIVRPSETVIQAIQRLGGRKKAVVKGEHFDIYEESYEQMVRILRRAGVIPDDWMVGTPILKPGERAEAIWEDDPLLSNPVNWEYKWATPPEGQSSDEVYGPFTSTEMKSWRDQGFFNQGILVRMVGDSTFEPGDSVTFE